MKVILNLSQFLIGSPSLDHTQRVICLDNWQVKVTLSVTSVDLINFNGVRISIGVSVKAMTYHSTKHALFSANNYNKVNIK